MRIGEQGDGASGHMGQHRGEIPRHVQSRVAQLDRERRPGGRVIDDFEAAPIEGPAEHTVMSEPVDRLPQ